MRKQYDAELRAIRSEMGDDIALMADALYAVSCMGMLPGMFDVGERTVRKTLFAMSAATAVEQDVLEAALHRLVAVRAH